jgi:AmmeMemoRadiSam system protein A
MPSPPESALSKEDRAALLQFARQCVQAAVTRTGNLNSPPAAILDSRCGVFVTLHVQGKLRGCIGVIEAEESLKASIPHCAASAALHDPRFSPVRAEELPSLQIEISILSSPAAIRPEEIEIGHHGLIVAKDRYRGLLLPQVAVEHNLDRISFLEETCRKAGLPRDAWKSGPLQILAFTCEVFSDHSESGASA